jgi:hypothetical protein
VAATLTIINQFLLNNQGLNQFAKQGPATGLITDAFTIPGINGTIHSRINTLATATAATVYDSANDLPATFQYLFFWSDVAMDLQLIGSATNFIVPITALVPFACAGGTLLAAANTTPITGGSAPALTAIAKAVIGNYSGGNGNYVFGVIN